MATPRASGDDRTTAVDAAAALRWMVAVAGELYRDVDITPPPPPSPCRGCGVRKKLVVGEITVDGLSNWM